MLLLQKFLEISERHGVGILKSHLGLTKGELLTLTFTNSISQGPNIKRKVDLKLNSNSTIYSMRFAIGRQFQCAWNEIQLIRLETNSEIDEYDNSKTIGELRFKNNEIFACRKQAMEEVMKDDMFDLDGTINPKLLHIFKVWFKDYSFNEKMTKQHCANFIRSCTNDNCKPTDNRIQRIFNKHDKKNVGYINE